MLIENDYDRLINTDHIESFKATANEQGMTQVTMASGKVSLKFLGETDEGKTKVVFEFSRLSREVLSTLKRRTGSPTEGEVKTSYPSSVRSRNRSSSKSARRRWRSSNRQVRSLTCPSGPQKRTPANR